MESWVLAGLCVNNPEEILDPKGELRKLMWRKGKYYIKNSEVYKRLAKEEIDVEKALAKSPSFREFLKVLKYVDSV